jgi:hypothetical protein
MSSAAARSLQLFTMAFLLRLLLVQPASAKGSAVLPAAITPVGLAALALCVVMVIWKRELLGRWWTWLLQLISDIRDGMTTRHDILHDRSYLEAIIKAEIDDKLHPPRPRPHPADGEGDKPSRADSDSSVPPPLEGGSRRIKR